MSDAGTGPEGSSFRPRAGAGRRATEHGGDAAPTDLETFVDEIARVADRVQAVIAAGRDVFVEGSASYDRASMAIIRLAALFQNEKRFGRFLASATDVERQGITHTRNIAGHAGYVAMNDDVFWETITVQVPRFIEKLRRENGV